MKSFHTQADQQAAARYWADKPRKIYAVDMEAGPTKGRPTFEATSYHRAASALKAIESAKRNNVHDVRGVRFRVRLAGPAELGCVAVGVGGA